MGIQYFKKDFFRTFDVSSRQGWEFLRDDASPRRRHNHPSKEETRGRKSLVSPEKIREMKQILEMEGIDARANTWEQLGYEVGLEYIGRTIRKAMGTIEYHKCIAGRRGWVNGKTRKDQLEYATVMLQRYHNSQDWYRVRFSDKVHFGYGPQDKLHIICMARFYVTGVACTSGERKMKIEIFSKFPFLHQASFSRCDSPQPSSIVHYTAVALSASTPLLLLGLA